MWYNINTVERQINFTEYRVEIPLVKVHKIKKHPLGKILWMWINKLPTQNTIWINCLENRDDYVLSTLLLLKYTQDKTGMQSWGSMVCYINAHSVVVTRKILALQSSVQIRLGAPDIRWLWVASLTLMSVFLKLLIQSDMNPLKKLWKIFKKLLTND